MKRWGAIVTHGEVGNQKAEVLSIPVDRSQDDDPSGRTRPVMGLGEAGRHTPCKPCFFASPLNTDGKEWGSFHLPSLSFRITEWAGRGLFQGPGTRYLLGELIIKLLRINT